MKKLLALVLVLAMSLFAFVGCTQETPVAEEPSAEEPVAEEPATEEPATEEPAAEGAVKTGLAVLTSVGKSKDASADAEGVGQSDSVVIAVTVDNEGKVVKAVIDHQQTKINFSAEGKVTTDLATVAKSKQVLKEEYGMGKASSLGKEWYEQANSLADYIVGKTAEEIMAIPTDEVGVTTDADLVSSVTIKLNDLKATAEKAIANAQDLGASADDVLGLAINTTVAKSKDAAADAEGQTQAYSIYTASTFDADGKITSNILDASQATVKFDATGKITSDLAAEVNTKVELGEAYGMIKASTIGKEWFEQAAAFSEYATGKTVEDLKGINLDETGHATDADLVSSVTFGIDEFILVIERAFASAK